MEEHDRGYRLLFSHSQVVADLLRGFVREPWVAQLDFSTLERLGSDFISSDLRDRYSDIIWRLLWRRQGEAPVPVYLILEFQSTPYRFMAVRLMTYHALLYEDVIRNRAWTSSRRLPPVLLLVVYNGNRRWTAPRDLESLVEPAPGALGRSLPRFSYTVLDERRVAPAELGGASNLVAALVRLEVSSSLEEMLDVAAGVSDLVSREREPELRRAFTVWMLRVLRRAYPGAVIPDLVDMKEIPMLEENLIRWREQGLRKARREGLEAGRQKGLKEGEMEGARKLLLRQLERRFGVLSPAVRQQVSAISSSRRLAELAEQVLVAESLEAMGLEAAS